MQKEACEKSIIPEKRIEELEKRLSAYENAHTPSSKNKRNYPRNEPSGNPIGVPVGHTGTLRNNKGTHIMEVIMSAIQTWKLQRLNPQTELRKILTS